MDPQTTKVPAETNPINKDKLLIHQGTAPPAAKKDFMSLPEVFEKESPINKIRSEKSTITI